MHDRQIPYGYVMFRLLHLPGEIDVCTCSLRACRTIFKPSTSLSNKDFFLLCHYCYDITFADYTPHPRRPHPCVFDRGQDEAGSPVRGEGAARSSSTSGRRGMGERYTAAHLTPFRDARGKREDSTGFADSSSSALASGRRSSSVPPQSPR